MLAALYAVVCYPVSGILWCWHQLFGAFLDPAGGASWALAVVFLVLTLRALLVRLALAQLRSTRALQGVQPEIRRYARSTLTTGAGWPPRCSACSASTASARSAAVCRRWPRCLCS